MKIDRIKALFTAVLLSAPIYSVPMQSLAEPPPYIATYPHQYFPQPYWNRTPPYYPSINQPRSPPLEQTRRPENKISDNKPEYFTLGKTARNPYEPNWRGVKKPGDNRNQIKQYNTPWIAPWQASNQMQPRLPVVSRYSGMPVYQYYQPAWPGAAPVYSAVPKKAPNSVEVKKNQKSVIRQVRITEQGFLPAQMSIKAGDRVLWANIDEIPHRVSSKNGFNSKLLTRGATYVRTFKQPGIYTYFSAVNPKMSGQVIVK